MRLTFAEFDLNPATRELLERGRPVHIAPKTFELLRALIEASPRALSKKEILDLICPATFVAEGTLAAAVAELRDFGASVCSESTCRAVQDLLDPPSLGVATEADVRARAGLSIRRGGQDRRRHDCPDRIAPGHRPLPRRLEARFGREGRPPRRGANWARIGSALDPRGRAA